MDKQVTKDFVRRARALMKRKKWVVHTLSRHLFDQNPYGFERLEEALRTGKGGPPHVNVLDAMKRLEDLEAEEKEEEPA